MKMSTGKLTEYRDSVRHFQTTGKDELWKGTSVRNALYNFSKNREHHNITTYFY